jgi:hypothetical protein
MRLASGYEVSCGLATEMIDEPTTKNAKITARQNRNRTARSVWSAGYAPALNHHPAAKAGAYPALQTLRAIGRAPVSLQPVSKSAYCRTEE